MPGMTTPTPSHAPAIRERLEYLREKLRTGIDLTWNEIYVIEDNAHLIDPNDAELRAWARGPEHDGEGSDDDHSDTVTPAT